jgi:hypothetical protein
LSTYENQNTPQEKPPKKKPPAVTSENGRPTINAEMVDDLFAETMQNLMALQLVWEKISLKEELK